MSKLQKKVILTILDGWGIGPEDKYNAIENARTPEVDRLIREYPNTQVNSDGLSVGLPEGSPGTSEVNHMTIGAGRVIMQDLPRINEAIKDLTFFNNEVINKTIEHAIENNSNLHLIGVVSKGGIHSHVDHLVAILKLCSTKNFSRVYIHAFTDGRDTPPRDAQSDLEYLQEKIDEIGVGTIATVQGRFWLDRDRDWAKTEKAFQLIRTGQGIEVKDFEQAIQYGYQNYETCEYFEQYIVDKKGLLNDNDSMFFFHFRTDRMYQLTKRILDEKLKNIYLGTFTSSSDDFEDHEAFPRADLNNTLADTLSAHKKRQLHITETEKFPHVTYFLNGENEHELPGEDWSLIQSNRMVKPKYNFEPSMRAFDITNQVIDAIKQDKYDFIVINYPNTDMVGHTGHYNAAVIAAEAVDYCVGKIYDTIKDKLDEYVLIVTADHGNSEEMWDYKNNQPHTRHTTNKVPLILVSDLDAKLKIGCGLNDLAPTILELIGVELPEAMTGKSMINYSK